MVISDLRELPPGLRRLPAAVGCNLWQFCGVFRPPSAVAGHCLNTNSTPQSNLGATTASLRNPLPIWRTGSTWSPAWATSWPTSLKWSHYTSYGTECTAFTNGDWGEFYGDHSSAHARASGACALPPTLRGAWSQLHTASAAATWEIYRLQQWSHRSP